jgi:hypothetical protein
MKTYFNRTIVVENTEVTRKVVEKNGKAVVRHAGQDKEVETVGGAAPESTQTKWTLKKAARS